MTELSCACGTVRLEVERAPIVSAACCCTSCREAGGRMEALPDAPSILSEHGTTRFVLYRKDRVRFLAGRKHLAEFRLSPGASTRRVIATCCNSPVFLDFASGHWLSLYGNLWPESTLPPLQMRTMSKDLPSNAVLPNDVPNARTQSVTFFAKLFVAWVGMGFRNPKIEIGETADV